MYIFIFIAIYVIVEATNIIYTAIFGFSHPMDQPVAYKKIRNYSVFIRYTLVVLAFLSIYKTNLLLAIIILFTPLVIDKIIFQYCKKREKSKLVKLYMKKNDSLPEFKPMTKEKAEQTATDMIDMYIKNKEYPF